MIRLFRIGATDDILILIRSGGYFVNKSFIFFLVVEFQCEFDFRDVLFCIIEHRFEHLDIDGHHLGLVVHGSKYK